MTTALSHKLIETDLELIKTWLVAQMPAELALISADRTSTIGQLGAPREYFTYDIAQAFQAPAIFIVPSSMDFRIYEKESNIINAMSRIFVNAVVEAQREQIVSYTAYRYQAALHQCLAQQVLLSADQSVKIVIKVVRARFSAVYTDAQKKGAATGVFRKEVLLELDVEHYERLFT